MNAEAKLATRENVSTASAPFGVIGAPDARKITHASSAMKQYDRTVAVSSITRRAI